MKILNLLMWVGQFGFSAIFPTVFFLLLAAWLQNKYSLGIWIVAVFAVLGVLTSISTVKSCMRSLRKAVEEASGNDEPPMGFNDHK